MTSVVALALMISLAQKTQVVAVGSCSLRLTPSPQVIAVRIDYADPQDRNTQGGGDFRETPRALGVDASELITLVRPLNANLTRPAGTFRCEGQTTGAGAKGELFFYADRQYVSHLQRVGIRFAERPMYDLMTAWVADVSIPYADAIVAQGYRVSLQQLAAFHMFGVTSVYLQDLRSVKE